MNWPYATQSQTQILLLLLAALLLSSCATGPREYWRGDTYTGISRDRLIRFASHEEFVSYFEAVYRRADEAGFWWAYERSHPFEGLVAQESAESDCQPDDPDCGKLEEITVTGSSVSGASRSITNNQELGVDEGDIVKHYKDFLIVLQDGRLFSVDIGRSANEMRVADRVNVYRNADDWAWYDELLISGNRLIVTAYSYVNDASEISIFEIDDRGRFEFLTTYYIQSQDYYSGSNYATRLVDDHLIIYTPLNMSEFDIDEGVVFPLYRQVRSDGAETFWAPLFEATDVFWPLQQTLQPVVHTISVCPIQGADEFRCKSTGIVGPANREFYVSPDYAYVWNSMDLYEIEEVLGDVQECPRSVLFQDYAALPSVLYRIPLFDGEPGAVHAAGHPPDQFSLDARSDTFHALVEWTPRHCWLSRNTPLRYARIDNRAFSQSPARPLRFDYAKLPASGGYRLQNRFAESYLAYSDRRISRRDFPSYREGYNRADLIVVPLDDPERTTRLSLGHDIERLEVLGGGLIAFGQYLFDGLHISTVTLDGTPRHADTDYLAGFFESEGRSHAFNFRIAENGAGLFGIPVTVREASRYWWRYRDRSDLSFFQFDDRLMMTDSGMLQGSDEPDDPAYVCETSCYDWYGNARPIFLYGRIFALTGTEIIEGDLRSGMIHEIGRISITTPPDRQNR